MKSPEAAGSDRAAAIVQVAGAEVDTAPGGDMLQRARAFAEPLLAGQLLDTGEGALAHADGVAAVLAGIGAAPSLCAAAYLVYAGDHLQRPDDTIGRAFGPSHAGLVSLTRQLVQIQRAARTAAPRPQQQAARQQTERVRKMLLAFSRDFRVVLLRLASRLQTLRWCAAARQPCPPPVATEALEVFAPLAHRLGIGQIKWELEDLAFRFLHPADYHRVARLVDETRAAREAGVAAARTQLAALLAGAGIEADVQGRPKHLYSIWQKMDRKALGFERLFDTRALRVVVAGDVAACYAVLARVHAWAVPVDGEFDDYIARPKGNGYRSLHTVVLPPDGKPLEVQIRTRAMHDHAEHGVAAHWLYKGPVSKGQPALGTEERVAEARKAVLRQLLAWERDLETAHAAGPGFDDRIYIFTPQATVIDLPAGATPIDFAYALHTDLGHRCRGARVDGALLPLHTPLQSGQTVEIVAAKEGGPSLDWLNPELGYLKSPRSKAKVRAWFNVQAQAQTIARGRELVEKVLQREGRTALKLDALADKLGFRSADALFEIVGKDEYSLRHIEQLLRPTDPAPADAAVALRPSRSGTAAGQDRGGVLVVGVESLLTALARCCRPAPPDAIGGFVTRDKGVAVHRADCSNFRHMAARTPGRVIDVAWGRAAADKPATLYPLDVVVEATDRPGLLRDIGEVFAKERMNVTGVHSGSTRDKGQAWMNITVEAADAARLAQALVQIGRVSGVLHARRR